MIVAGVMGPILSAAALLVALTKDSRDVAVDLEARLAVIECIVHVKQGCERR